MIDMEELDIRTVFEQEFMTTAMHRVGGYDIARKISKKSQQGIYIIYYSGHGRLVNGKTMGVDKDGKNIDLEKFVYEISQLKN